MNQLIGESPRNRAARGQDGDMDVEDLLQRIPTGLFIDGVWESTDSTFAVLNPATGRPLTSVADASASDAVRALDSAASAQQAWSATEPRARGELLRAAYERIHARADDFAWTMTLEMGKPLAEAHGEVNYGAEFFRWFSEEAVRIDGRYAVAPSGRARILTMKQPVGPVFAITPWNFPLAMGTRKIGPALAAGCTVVVKPASSTPLTTLLLMDVLAEVGLPAGVVNCVTTSHSGTVSEPIIRDPRLRKLTFTGSTEVGKVLLAQASERVLRTSMELGGNAPFLVLPSADLDRAVAGALAAKMRNIGEACTAANRFIVHSSLVDRFATKLADAVAALRVGDGTADGVDVGPLINRQAVDHVESLVSDAVARGATVLTGGARREGPGFFMQPTVLTGVPADARVMTEEIFGPAAPITSYDTIDEAIELANATPFGLISYVFGQDLDETMAVVERLETGMVGLNSGVQSRSAIWRSEGIGARARGELRGHRGVSRDEVRGDRPRLEPKPLPKHRGALVMKWAHERSRCAVRANPRLLGCRTPPPRRRRPRRASLIDRASRGVVLRRRPRVGRPSAWARPAGSQDWHVLGRGRLCPGRDLSGSRRPGDSARRRGPSAGADSYHGCPAHTVL